MGNKITLGQFIIYCGFPAKRRRTKEKEEELRKKLAALELFEAFLRGQKFKANYPEYARQAGLAPVAFKPRKPECREKLKDDNGDVRHINEEPSSENETFREEDEDVNRTELPADDKPCDSDDSVFIKDDTDLSEAENGSTKANSLADNLLSGSDNDSDWSQVATLSAANDVSKSHDQGAHVPQPDPTTAAEDQTPRGKEEATVPGSESDSAENISRTPEGDPKADAQESSVTEQQPLTEEDSALPERDLIGPEKGAEVPLTVQREIPSTSKTTAVNTEDTNSHESTTVVPNKNTSVPQEPTAVDKDFVASETKHLGPKTDSSEIEKDNPESEEDAPSHNSWHDNSPAAADDDNLPMVSPITSEDDESSTSYSGPSLLVGFEPRFNSTFKALGSRPNSVPALPRSSCRNSWLHKPVISQSVSEQREIIALLFQSPLSPPPPPPLSLIPPHPPLQPVGTSSDRYRTLSSSSRRPLRSVTFADTTEEFEPESYSDKSQEQFDSFSSASCSSSEVFDPRPEKDLPETEFRPKMRRELPSLSESQMQNQGTKINTQRGKKPRVATIARARLPPLKWSGRCVYNSAFPSLVGDRIESASEDEEFWEQKLTIVGQRAPLARHAFYNHEKIVDHNLIPASQLAKDFNPHEVAAYIKERRRQCNLCHYGVSDVSCNVLYQRREMRDCASSRTTQSASVDDSSSVESSAVLNALKSLHGDLQQLRRDTSKHLQSGIPRLRSIETRQRSLESRVDNLESREVVSKSNEVGFNTDAGNVKQQLKAIHEDLKMLLQRHAEKRPRESKVKTKSNARPDEDIQIADIEDGESPDSSYQKGLAAAKQVASPCDPVDPDRQSLTPSAIAQKVKRDSMVERGVLSWERLQRHIRETNSSTGDWRLGMSKAAAEGDSNIVKKLNKSISMQELDTDCTRITAQKKNISEKDKVSDIRDGTQPERGILNRRSVAEQTVRPKPVELYSVERFSSEDIQPSQETQVRTKVVKEDMQIDPVSPLGRLWEGEPQAVPERPRKTSRDDYQSCLDTPSEIPITEKDNQFDCEIPPQAFVFEDDIRRESELQVQYSSSQQCKERVSEIPPQVSVFDEDIRRESEHSVLHSASEEYEEPVSDIPPQSSDTSKITQHGPESPSQSTVVDEILYLDNDITAETPAIEETQRAPKIPEQSLGPDKNIWSDPQVPSQSSLNHEFSQHDKQFKAGNSVPDEEPRRSPNIAQPSSGADKNIHPYPDWPSQSSVAKEIIQFDEDSHTETSTAKEEIHRAREIPSLFSGPKTNIPSDFEIPSQSSVSEELIHTDFHLFGKTSLSNKDVQLACHISPQSSVTDDDKIPSHSSVACVESYREISAKTSVAKEDTTHLTSEIPSPSFETETNTQYENEMSPHVSVDEKVIQFGSKASTETPAKEVDAQVASYFPPQSSVFNEFVQAEHKPFVNITAEKEDKQWNLDVPSQVPITAEKEDKQWNLDVPSQVPITNRFTMEDTQDVSEIPPQSLDRTNNMQSGQEITIEPFSTEEMFHSDANTAVEVISGDDHSSSQVSVAENTTSRFNIPSVIFTGDVYSNHESAQHISIMENMQFASDVPGDDYLVGGDTESNPELSAQTSRVQDIHCVQQASRKENDLSPETPEKSYVGEDMDSGSTIACQTSSVKRHIQPEYLVSTASLDDVGVAHSDSRISAEISIAENVHCIGPEFQAQTSIVEQDVRPRPMSAGFGLIIEENNHPEGGVPSLPSTRADNIQTDEISPKLSAEEDIHVGTENLFHYLDEAEEIQTDQEVPSQISVTDEEIRTKLKVLSQSPSTGEEKILRAHLPSRNHVADDLHSELSILSQPCAEHESLSKQDFLSRTSVANEEIKTKPQVASQDSTVEDNQSRANISPQIPITADDVHSEADISPQRTAEYHSPPKPEVQSQIIGAEQNIQPAREGTYAPSTAVEDHTLSNLNTESQTSAERESQFNHEVLSKILTEEKDRQSAQQTQSQTSGVEDIQSPSHTPAHQENIDHCGQETQSQKSGAINKFQSEEQDFQSEDALANKDFQVCDKTPGIPIPNISIQNSADFLQLIASVEEVIQSSLRPIAKHGVFKESSSGHTKMENRQNRSTSAFVAENYVEADRDIQVQDLIAEDESDKEKSTAKADVVDNDHQFSAHNKTTAEHFVANNVVLSSQIPIEVADAATAMTTTGKFEVEDFQCDKDSPSTHHDAVDKVYSNTDYDKPPESDNTSEESTLATKRDPRDPSFDANTLIRDQGFALEGQCKGDSASEAALQAGSRESVKRKASQCGQEKSAVNSFELKEIQTIAPVRKELSTAVSHSDSLNNVVKEDVLCGRGSPTGSSVTENLENAADITSIASAGSVEFQSSAKSVSETSALDEVVHSRYETSRVRITPAPGSLSETSTEHEVDSAIPKSFGNEVIQSSVTDTTGDIVAEEDIIRTPSVGDRPELVPEVHNNPSQEQSLRGDKEQGDDHEKEKQQGDEEEDKSVSEVSESLSDMLRQLYPKGFDSGEKPKPKRVAPDPNSPAMVKLREITSKLPPPLDPVQREQPKENSGGKQREETERLNRKKKLGLRRSGKIRDDIVSRPAAEFIEHHVTDEEYLHHVFDSEAVIPGTDEDRLGPTGTPDGGGLDSWLQPGSGSFDERKLRRPTSARSRSSVSLTDNDSENRNTLPVIGSKYPSLKPPQGMNDELQRKPSSLAQGHLNYDSSRSHSRQNVSRSPSAILDTLLSTHASNVEDTTTDGENTSRFHGNSEPGNSNNRAILNDNGHTGFRETSSSFHGHSYSGTSPAQSTPNARKPASLVPLSMTQLRQKSGQKGSTRELASKTASLEAALGFSRVGDPWKQAPLPGIAHKSATASLPSRNLRPKLLGMLSPVKSSMLPDIGQRPLPGSGSAHDNFPSLRNTDSFGRTI